MRLLSPFLAFLFFFFCGCNTHPVKRQFSQFGNDILCEDSDNLDAEEYHAFQTEMEDLLENTFTNQELNLLVDSSSDSELIQLRKNIVSDYSNENIQLYHAALKDYLGESIYNKLTSDDFTRRYSDIIRNHLSKLIQKETARQRMPFD